MLIEHVEDKAAIFHEIARVLRHSGLWLLRTMLPNAGVDETTRYRFLPRAAELEKHRSLAILDVEKLASGANFRLISSQSYRNRVDRVVARTLPDRIRARSYEILKEFDWKEIDAACRDIESALEDDGYREYMSSSLIILARR